jgi:Porin subfamily
MIAVDQWRMSNCVVKADVILRLALLVALIATPAAAGEMTFGKPQPPARPQPQKSDRCTATYGEGFSDLAGTGACVKIGGRVRVDFGATRGGGASGPTPSLPDKSSSLGSAAQGFAEADYRQPLLGQTLHVFARVRGGMGDPLLLRGGERQ